MAVSSGDIIRGVWGAWRLARRDTSGMAMFDVSPDGAAKSFVAAVLAFPPYMVIQAFLLSEKWPLLLQPGPLLIETLGFIAGWALMPAAMTWILPQLNRGPRLSQAIVAYNWALLLITLVQLLLTLLTVAGLFPSVLGLIASVAVAVACYLYEGFVLRTAVEVDVPIAAGLVVFDAVLSYLLGTWVDVIAQAAM
ncbi:hypothetical protein E9232_001138 [Inquilinus ginsengisoli]|uniref:Yip1 domain-containing protein n=1 Tax=Inquilinus ginsengisoli TaxID=363840 RepID=A0ABU1JJ44_9PROT|nr:hypothetical protein [Inquilinus ginsengisoli]MDR6288631.1 hypothetical protein [Inquilinus ginsengisoli]